MNFLKNKENIKQISLGLTAVLFIFLGVANYNSSISDEYGSFFEENDTTTIEVASRNVPDENLGDVELVSSTPAIVENDDLAEPEEDDYFKKTSLERDKMYSQMLETYQNLINSVETPEDQKAISVKEISNITNIKNGIMISENLIKNKGFEEVVILVNKDVVNVVVKAYTLNKEEISKIQNIVERELNADVKNINISNKF